ncbi:MAG: DUF86 domain-containing protein [Syntrophobacteraceae bacterium]|nr:DUF86 domain-containing protein [Syntrophobacteraceae bacterium]
MPNRDWRFRIEDIIAAIEDINSLTADLTYPDLSANTTIFKAILYDMAVIGEAAYHLPADIITRYPEMPWREMSDMRNVVIHEYFGVDQQIVWETIKHDLPQLLPALRRILQFSNTENTEE